MVKLKKFKYYNTCSKDTFLKIINDIDQISIYKIKDKGEIIEFYSDALIKHELVQSKRLATAFLKKVILPNLLFIIGFIAVLFIFYTSPNYIREIKYEKGSATDQIVVDYIKKKMVNNKLECSINDLSKELTIKFPHYAFIGLLKKGSVVYVKIEIQDTINKIPSFDNCKGDFVSKYNAYIEHIVIERGSIVTTLNTTVKKGDLLVSGNLKYLTNPNDNSIYTSPKGIIIGRVIEQKSYKIKKHNKYQSYTGTYSEYKRYYLFNKCLNKQNYINEKDNYIRKEKVFNIFNFFQIWKEIEYSKEEVMFVYDQNKVLEYTKSLIYYELEKERTSNLEKINSIKKIALIEHDDYFEVIYLIDKSVNIVSFKQNT